MPPGVSGGSRAHSSLPRSDSGFVLWGPDSAEGIPWATQPRGELRGSLWEPREGGTARLPLETPSGTAQMEQLIVLRLRRVALAVQNRHSHRPNVPLALGKGALPAGTHAPSAAKPASSSGSLAFPVSDSSRLALQMLIETSGSLTREWD